MCTMIGVMAVQWAWAENALAIIIGCIEERCGQIPGYPNAPLNLDRRVECLKRAVRDIPRLKPFQEEGRLLAIRFKRLGKRRHDLIHGAAWQLSNGTFQSLAIKVKAGESSVHNHRFNQNDAILLNIEITKLTDDVMSFLVRIEAFLP
jgi:hypothetical protein